MESFMGMFSCLSTNARRREMRSRALSLTAQGFSLLVPQEFLERSLLASSTCLKITQLQNVQKKFEMMAYTNPSSAVYGKQQIAPRAIRVASPMVNMSCVHA